MDQISAIAKSDQEWLEPTAARTGARHFLPDPSMAPADRRLMQTQDLQTVAIPVRSFSYLILGKPVY